MAYRSPSRPFPLIISDTPMSDALFKRVHAAVSGSGRLVPHNLVAPEGRKDKWGHQLRMRVGSISLSDLPFQGIPEAETWCPQIGRHVLLNPDSTDDEEQPIGLMTCSASKR